MGSPLIWLNLRKMQLPRIMPAGSENSFLSMPYDGHTKQPAPAVVAHDPTSFLGPDGIIGDENPLPRSAIAVHVPQPMPSPSTQQDAAEEKRLHLSEIVSRRDALNSDATRILGGL